MTSTYYEILPLDTFRKSLSSFPQKSRKKINKKIEQFLTENPYRNIMLEGVFVYKGISFAGLRRMKIGVEGYRGGVYILYRICEECRENRYYIKSNKKCEFCDDGKEKRVVLFLVRPRSMGYS